MNTTPLAILSGYAMAVRALTDAAVRGARAFVSDIELPSPARDSEAYQRWGELGFSPVYRRELYTKANAK